MLQDNFARKFHYVRLSLTERCNFKCQYCLPHGYIKNSCNEPLTLDELRNLMAGLVDLGIWKVRLTGGEPTLRRDLTEIMTMIRSFPQIQQLALTTNGYKLRTKLDEYLAHGLTHLNISVDSLKREQFQEITGVDRLPQILDAVDYAMKLPLMRVKLNAVLLQSTPKELDFFLEYVSTRKLDIRFIELMETGDNHAYFRQNYLPAQELITKLQSRGWTTTPAPIGSGPAKMFSHLDYKGQVGVIAPYSKDFCTGCNRLRFSQNGALRLCLFGEGSYALRHLLQSPKQKPELIATILQALTTKPKQHLLHAGNSGNLINLSQIGG